MSSNQPLAARLIVVVVNFIQQPLPPGSSTGAAGTDGQAGALGLGQRVSRCPYGLRCAIIRHPF